MFFLPEYDILYKAAHNLPRTTPLEGKVHNPQGRTHCHRQKQGIRRTSSFLFCPDGRSTGASPRRNASLFSQNTYHPRTAYRGLPDLSGKQSLVNVHEGLFLKRGMGKEGVDHRKFAIVLVLHPIRKWSMKLHISYQCQALSTVFQGGRWLIIGYISLATSVKTLL